VPNVAHVSFFIDALGREPEQLLEAWPSLVDVAEAATGAGQRVTVIQACRTSAQLTRNAVDYRFVSPGAGRSSISHSSTFRSLIDTLGVDVFHVHGLGFPAEVTELARLAPRVPILLQDHADRLPRFWRRPSWRRGLHAASGIAFCAREQAHPFAQAGLLGPKTEIFELPESTARFTPGDRLEARRSTGLSGNPCLLWVGHLDQNKDPLTVLQGIGLAARQLPDLRLWCCFGKAPQFAAVRARIERDAGLRDKVHLLGSVPHRQVELLMRAADLFVLGSHREGSGYALTEALACGLPPVVTDIPSFRAMTGRGTVGWLWPSGDARGMCDALLAAASRPYADHRAQVRTHFEQELSFEAVGRKLGAAYARLIARDAAPVAAANEDAA
jgi:glycosyltransferase involved in cell wall biosynthesis